MDCSTHGNHPHGWVFMWSAHNILIQQQFFAIREFFKKKERLEYMGLRAYYPTHMGLNQKVWEPLGKGWTWASFNRMERNTETKEWICEGKPGRQKLEISGTEEMMPAVSYQMPVASGMDEEVIQSGHVPRVPYRAVWFMCQGALPGQTVTDTAVLHWLWTLVPGKRNIFVTSSAFTECP